LWPDKTGVAAFWRIRWHPLCDDSSSKETRVEEIMTRDLIVVRPENTVDECMRIMTDRRVRHLPVLDRGKLVGIVSIGDLVNAVIADQVHTINQLHTYIGSKYPA
jgi:CBS domain-containing protein